MKIGDICKRFGLTRIQRSAFIGYLASASRKELISTLRKVLGESDGNIQVFVICKPDLSLRVVIGKPYHEYSSEAGELFV